MNERAPVTRLFVRTQATAARRPPLSERGLLGWMRDKLFPTPLSGMTTIVGLLLLVWLIPDLVRFLFIDAVWSASDGEPCRAPGAGACWAYVAQKFDFFMYGAYPREEVWRVNLVLVMGAALTLWLLWPDAAGKSVAAVGFFVLYPLIAFGLLTGSSPFPTSWLPETPFGQIVLSLVLVLIFALGLTLLTVGWRILAFICLGLVFWTILGSSWTSMNLRHVGTELWGGIFVSLLVATVGIVFSLPLGVVLALGRRSEMPVVRFLSILLIEFVRGVPLITVLFMANTMLPLFVPQEWTPDRLLRPLLGVALFASVYMAEVVRGGLQAIPKGQYEGAMSVGLSWSQMMRLIVLPQALVLVIPGVVNSFIALFKDTTLVAIVGIFDFLRAVDTQRLDPNWAGPTISTTGYIFAAMFYFVFCFAMSRYAAMMERRHSAGRKR